MMIFYQTLLNALPKRSPGYLELHAGQSAGTAAVNMSPRGSRQNLSLYWRQPFLYDFLEMEVLHSQLLVGFLHPWLAG